MTQANHSNQLSTGVHKNEHEDIEALGEWITVVRKLAPERHNAGKTDDGREVHLELPATARDRMEAEYAGKVVSIGDDAAKKMPKLQLGDRIVYGRCFPMAKQGSKEEIFSLVHVGNIMGRINNAAITPGMAPVADGLKQS